MKKYAYSYDEAEGAINLQLSFYSSYARNSEKQAINSHIGDMEIHTNGNMKNSEPNVPFASANIKLIKEATRHRFYGFGNEETERDEEFYSIAPGDEDLDANSIAGSAPGEDANKLTTEFSNSLDLNKVDLVQALEKIND